MQARKEMHKEGSLPTLQVVSFPSNLEDSSLILAVASRLDFRYALYQMKLCLRWQLATPESQSASMQQHRLLGIPLATSSYGVLTSHRISNQVRELGFKVLYFRKNRTCPLKGCLMVLKEKLYFFGTAQSCSMQEIWSHPRLQFHLPARLKSIRSFLLTSEQGYKVCTNMYLKTKSKARNQKVK